MAPNREAVMLPASIATSLDHLTHRPGVVGTLILSRKDGNIIRATGFLAESQPGATNERPTSNGSMPTEKEDALKETVETSAVTEAQEQAKQDPTPAEVLASSVIAFVSSAASVSANLRDALAGADRRTGSYGVLNGGNQLQSNNNTGNNDMGGQGTTEVQLLRMRTKKHEIVIFPDNRFLSCVVQEMGKHTQGADAGLQKS